jgi:hypothetical protein
MRHPGNLLIITGIILFVLGLFLSMGGGLSWIGRLPGDLRIERPGLHLYLPITTSILVSVLVGVVMYLFRLFR